MMLPKLQPYNELTQENHEQGDILREHSGSVQTLRRTHELSSA